MDDYRTLVERRDQLVQTLVQAQRQKNPVVVATTTAQLVDVRLRIREAVKKKYRDGLNTKR